MIVAEGPPPARLKGLQAPVRGAAFAPTDLAPPREPRPVRAALISPGGASIT